MNILQQILQAKRERVRVLRKTCIWSMLEGDPLFAEPRRSLASALRREEGPVKFLGEMIRALPGSDEVMPEREAAGMAEALRAAGAVALGLVTEEDFFHGRPADLPLLRAEGLPVLMSDFFLDPLQAGQARALGADAILLVAALGDRPLLREVRAAARDLGLETVCQVQSEGELDLAHELGCEIVAASNRDLSDLSLDLEAGLRLFPLLPAGAVRVSMEGILQRTDVVRMEKRGFDAVFVGEALIWAGNPGAVLRALRGESERG